MNQSKGQKEEVISEAETTIAEAEAETEGTTTDSTTKIENYERHC